jgi:hypothetical protein
VIEPPHVVQPRDVLAAEAREHARLAEESLGELGELAIRRRRCEHQLDRTRLPELHMGRREDDARSSPAEQAVDPVSAGDKRPDRRSSDALKVAHRRPPAVAPGSSPDRKSSQRRAGLQPG